MDDDDVSKYNLNQLVDPAWTHLQPVYEYFLQLIVNEQPDVRALKVNLFLLQRSTSLTPSFKSFSSSLTQKNPERESISRTSSTGFMLSSFQGEQWSERPSTIVSTHWFTKHTNSMEQPSSLISSPALSVDLPSPLEKSMSSSSRPSSFPCIRCRLASSTTSNYWDVPCSSFQRTQPWPPSLWRDSSDIGPSPTLLRRWCSWMNSSKYWKCVKSLN